MSECSRCTYQSPDLGTYTVHRRSHHPGLATISLQVPEVTALAEAPAEAGVVYVTSTGQYWARLGDGAWAAFRERV